VDDVPGLEALGAAWPQSSPVLALCEPARRVLERAAPGVSERLGLLERGSAPGYEERVKMTAGALRELLALVREKGAAVGVVQYWKLSELRSGKADAGHDALKGTVEAAGVRVWQTSEEEGRSAGEPALFLPGDDVHPSAAGQARLGEVLERCVLELMQGREKGASEKPGGG
jgi:hypothetical protein